MKLIRLQSFGGSLRQRNQSEMANIINPSCTVSRIRGDVEISAKVVELANARDRSRQKEERTRNGARGEGGSRGGGRHLSQEEFPRNPCGEKKPREETGRIIREMHRSSHSESLGLREAL